ncbi:hypothetical protein GSY71_15595 [Pusillimonas sp. TS35]|uniref:hypothetical protein n=1 Tax=Paracandidimonas lactea TaxID=2895524 RepID=UPI00136FE664|nr:hypothetical protein [Paracandidimonas lactea]MYN14562.1 hypothetical protein [Pusillimonas sp. TS35]
MFVRSLGSWFVGCVALALTGQAGDIRAQPLPGEGSPSGNQGWHSWANATTYPVAPTDMVTVRALPPLPLDVGSRSSDPIEQALAQDDGASYGASAPGLPLAGAEPYTAPPRTGPAVIPDRYTWAYIAKPRPVQPLSRSSPGLRGVRARLNDGRAVPRTLPWTTGARNWSMTTEGGTLISVGSQSIGDPQWARNATLGGVRVSERAAPGAADTWRYSVALGAIDTAPGRQSGDLAFGSQAGYALLGYDVSASLSLETQIEAAPQLLSTGTGGTLRTEWGAWTAGVARASGSLYQGWRYQAGYSVNVLDDIALSWLGEATTAGFSDLSSYETGAAQGSASRQQWSATVPVQGWGDVTGSYERTMLASGDLRERFGYTQQFWYSPNLRIGLQARTEPSGGNYDVSIRFSVPVF